MKEFETEVQNTKSPLFSEALWEFSLRYYQAPGIKNACLLLQNNFSGNVLILLWNKWLDQQQLVMAAEDHQHISSYVQQQCEQRLVPLRKVREHLKYSLLYTEAQKIEQKKIVLENELTIEKELLLYLQRQTIRYGKNYFLAGHDASSHYSTKYVKKYLALLNIEKALQRLFTEPFR